MLIYFIFLYPPPPPEIIIDNSGNSKEAENTLLQVISHNEFLISQPERDENDNSYGRFEPIGRSTLIMPSSVVDCYFTVLRTEAKETIFDDKEQFEEVCTQSQMTYNSA